MVQLGNDTIFEYLLISVPSTLLGVWDTAVKKNRVPNKADMNCNAFFEAKYMTSLVSVGKERASFVLGIVPNMWHAHWVSWYLQKPYEVGINYNFIL